MIKRNFKQTFSLLNVDFVQLTSKWHYMNVISPYSRIYYISSGEGELSDSQGMIKLEEGYLYVIPSFTLCNMNCNSHLGQYFVQFFEDSADGKSIFGNNRSIDKVKATPLDIMLFEKLLEINPGRGLTRSDNPRIYEKDIFYKEYQELNNQQNMSVYLETQGILQQLASRFLSIHSSKHSEHSIIPMKISETINYISVNLQHDLTVVHLATRVNQHTDYFSRQFKLHTGSRPLNYINEKRIERAQYLMATSSMNYSEIAVETGFSDVSYFSKTFRKVTGLSPREYKRQMYLVGFNH